MSIKEVATELRKNGAKSCEVTIKSVTLKEGEMDKIYFKFYDKVDGMVKDENDVMVKGLTDIAGVLRGNFVAVLRENEELVAVAKVLAKKEAILNLVFVGAEVEILCEDVAKDTVYKNPFAENAKEKPVTKDSVYHHLVQVKKLSNKGEDYVKKLIDKVLEDALKD